MLGRLRCSNNLETVAAQSFSRDPSPILGGAGSDCPRAVSPCHYLCQPPISMGRGSRSSLADFAVPIDCSQCYALAPANRWPTSRQCRRGCRKTGKGSVARRVCRFGIGRVERPVKGLIGWQRHILSTSFWPLRTRRMASRCAKPSRG